MSESADPPETIVFRSKLVMPQARGLVRPRLLGALDGIWRSQLGLVTAPAGSGKTTLVAQYGRLRAEATAWLRAECADADCDRFLRHLVRALTDALGLPSSPDGGLDRLVSGLERWPGERALVVVDDVHLLEASAALDLLQRLTSLTPPGVRLLLVGRAEPAGLDLTRLRLSEELCEVTADDLRFRSWEIERLFREVYHSPLPPDTVNDVADRTGGWAAGLQLLHLAAAPTGTRESRASGVDLVARSRLLGGYLVANVLDELPIKLRRFVRETSALGLLTADLCDRLRNASDSQAVLEDLERRQICRAVPGGYRFLPLLQAHLDTALRRTVGGADEYVLAGRMLEQSGAYADALRAYACASDWDDTARLLRCHGEQVIAERWSVRWDDVLPPGLLSDDPWLLLDAARRKVASGQLHRAADLYERAERGATEPSVQALARREREVFGGWSGSAPYPGSDWHALLWRAVRGRPLAASRRASDRAAAGGLPAWRLTAGLAALLAGHAAEAEAQLSVLATGLPTDDPAIVVAARLGGLVARLFLRESPSHQVVEAIALQAEMHDLPWFARLSRALLALTGRPDDREEAAAVRRDCERDGDDWGALLAGLLDACRRLLDGADPGAPAERAALLARRLGAGVLECWARSLLVVGLARDGAAEAELAAQGVEAAARNAEVPGARGVALVALAACNPPGERREETLALGMALLAECGLRPGPVLSDLLSASAPVVPAPDRAGHAPVELRCFGGFALRVEGRELDLREIRPRARATLRLLALHAGTPVHRETLIQALWPDRPAASALHALQVAISALRRLLEPEASRGASRWLVRDGDAYVLVLPAGSRLDVRDFRLAHRQWRQVRGSRDLGAETAALRRALAAYGGDLLPEDGPAEWVVGERERMRLEAAEIATALGEVELAAGRAGAAAEALERAVRIDPFRDTAWRSLCLAYREVGDVAAAARARREYDRMLTELEVAAAPVTVS